MLAGTILGAALVIGVLLLSRVSGPGNGAQRHFIGVAGAGIAIAVLVAVIAINVDDREPEPDRQFANSGLAVAAVARASSSLRNDQAPARAVPTAGTVPSLIDGLKSRLENEPEDASGWALLAQSYAFVGNDEAAEQALMRAVQLGLEESDLRQRVNGARRDPRQHAAGAGRDPHAGLDIDLSRLR